MAGAGILGLWQALDLARAGHRVTLVEESTEPFRRAASRLAGVMLAPEREAETAPPLLRTLGRRGVTRWRALCPLVVEAGSLVVAGARCPLSAPVEEWIAALPPDERARVDAPRDLSEEAKAALLGSARCLVLPSRHESFGIVLAEAWAHGTPVVAFANTGQFDIVDHRINGYLADNLSPADLARGIAWCLEETERGSALSREARSKALRCFDIRDVAHRHIALYERLLERQRSAVMPTSTGVPRETLGALPGGTAGS